MVFSPIIAGAIGKFGKKPLILVIDFIFGIGIFLFMRTLPVSPSYLVVLGIVMVGIHYSIFVAIIWPSMTLTVPQTTTAAALGLATTIQNFFIAALAYYFGYVNLPRTKKAYDFSLYSLAVVGSVSLFLSIIVLILDARTGKILTLPDADKRVTILRRKMQKEFNERSSTRAKEAETRKTISSKTRLTITKTQTETETLNQS